VVGENKYHGGLEMGFGAFVREQEILV